MIEILPAKPIHARLLAPKMRLEDVAEVKAASGLSPLEALLTGLDVSNECYTAWADDAPIAMFGVCPSENASCGRIWLLGSDVIKAHRIDFLRKSRDWVDWFQSRYPVLHNTIDARNTVHIRWLQWLGFSFIQEFPNFGTEQRLFYQFVRIPPHV